MRIRRLVVACFVGVTVATAGLWALAEPPKAGFLPDPPAHLAQQQWVFDIAYQKGASTLERVRSISAKKPTATPRVMGRFALEWWVGRELLDRVRFDVPLLGDDEREHDPKRPFKRPTFSRVTTRIKVQMADHPRTTVLAFVDRATGDTRRYFWPPDEKGQLTPFSAKAATVGDGTALTPSLTADGGTDAATDATIASLDAATDAAPDGSSLPLAPRAADASVTALDAGPAATTSARAVTPAATTSARPTPTPIPPAPAAPTSRPASPAAPAK